MRLLGGAGGCKYSLPPSSIAGELPDHVSKVTGPIPYGNPGMRDLVTWT